MRLRFLTQTTAERREMILNGNGFKTLILLSLPTLMMAVVQSLIPITDGLFLNNTSSVEVAGAVGFAIPIINMLTGLSQGLSVAAMSILGQLFGKGDLQKVKHCASQTMFYSFLLGLVIAPLTIVGAWILSRTVDPAIAKPLFHYLSIYALVMPFIFIASVYNAVKSSMGKPEANFVRMVLLFFLKLVFNAIFLSWLRLNEYGAVLASLCSYVSISIWMFHDLYIVDSEMKLSFRNMKPDKDYLKSLVKLAIPSMLSTMMINLGFLLINMEVEAFGKVALNAQTIAANINAMAFAVPSSISQTITVMVSMNVGINREKNAKKSFLIGTAVGIALGAIIVAIFVPLAPHLVRMFRQEPEIIDIAVRALNIYTWSTFGFAIFMACNGAFIGLGRTKMTLISGVLRIWFIRYLFIRVFVGKMGLDAVFWGNLFSNCACAVIFFIILMKLPWKSVLQKQLDKISA